MKAYFLTTFSSPLPLSRQHSWLRLLLLNCLIGFVIFLSAIRVAASGWERRCCCEWIVCVFMCHASVRFWRGELPVCCRKTATSVHLHIQMRDLASQPWYRSELSKWTVAFIIIIILIFYMQSARNQSSSTLLEFTIDYWGCGLLGEPGSEICVLCFQDRDRSLHSRTH